MKQLQNLPDFLASLNLKNLSLLGEIENSKSYGQTFVDRLASAISQMTNLTHLDILVKNLFSYSNPFKTSDDSDKVIFLKFNITAVMNNLEVFSLYGRVDNLKDLLSVLGPNCWHLQLESTGLTDSALEEVLQKNPVIKDAIKKLVLRVVLPKQVESFCKNFSSLSSLELFNAVSASNFFCLFLIFFCFLQKQTAFEDFLQYINIESLTDLRVGSFLKLYNNEQDRLDGINVQQLPRNLPQIRRLTIESMHSFRIFNLGQMLNCINEMFPNLEKINLGLSFAVSMAYVYSSLEAFKFLDEFRLFYTGKLQSHLVPSHQMVDFDPNQLAKHYLYKKTQNRWEMIERGHLPPNVVRDSIICF